MPHPRKPLSPLRRFNSLPEIIRLVVMMYVRFSLSLRNVVDLLNNRLKIATCRSEGESGQCFGFGR